MPISGISNFPIVPAASQRSGTAERAGRATSGNDDPVVIQQAASASSRQRNDELNQRAASNPYAQQQVEASSRSSETFSRPQPQENQNLTLTAQKALKAFAENTPSPEQRLGIELAGIDTFV